MLPIYTYEQIAKFLTDDGWSYFDKSRQYWNLNSDRTLTVDASRLPDYAQQFVRSALNVWTNAAGIVFDVNDQANADITFYSDEGRGAYARNFTFGSYIYEAQIYIGEDLIGTFDYFLSGFSEGAPTYTIDADSFAFFVFIHEIGHVLGLAHGGYYNGTASYPNDAHYANDSTQASVMSYFFTDENSYVDASFYYPITPMIADIVAMQDLYGKTNDAALGDSQYGEQPTEDTKIKNGIITDFAQAGATIFDNGGNDTINFSTQTADQLIDLRPEGISNVGGARGNLLIAPEVYIENALTGSGNDILYGNNIDNQLYSGGGNDLAHGYAGADTIKAGIGDDTLYGGDGSERLESTFGNNALDGESGHDFVIGGVSADTLKGGAGNDVLMGEADAFFLGAPDTIDGGTGNDLLFGGLGIDTFVFRPNEGDDTIAAFAANDVSVTDVVVFQKTQLSQDFQIGLDRVSLEGFTSVIANNLSSFINSSADGAVFEAEGSKIVFFGVIAGDLTADHFIFA